MNSNIIIEKQKKDPFYFYDNDFETSSASDKHADAVWKLYCETNGKIEEEDGENKSHLE